MPTLFPLLTYKRALNKFYSENTMKNESNPNIGTALRYAFTTYKQHFIKLTALPIVFGFLLIAASTLLIGLVVAIFGITPFYTLKDCLSNFTREQITQCFLQFFRNSIHYLIICLLLLLAVLVFFCAGFFKAVLHVYDTSQVRFSLLWSFFNKRFIYLYFSTLFLLILFLSLYGLILYGLLLLLGIAALATIPLLAFSPLLLASIYGFFYFRLIESNYGVFEAFSYSAQLTKGLRIKVFLFVISIMGISMAMSTFKTIIPKNVVAMVITSILGFIISWIIAPLAWTYFYRRLQAIKKM